MKSYELIPITIGKLKAEAPKDWNYDRSVKKWGDIRRALKKGMVEALHEVKFAHQLLTEDSKKKKGRRWPDRTFETYCNDIGIDKKTAYKYLHIHFPQYLPLRIVEESTIPQEKAEETKVIIVQEPESNKEEIDQYAKIQIMEEEKEKPGFYTAVVKEVVPRIHNLTGKFEHINKVTEDINFDSPDITLLMLALEGLMEKIETFKRAYDNKKGG
jgi:hypothetical protein